MNSFNVTIGQDKKQVFINVYYNNNVTDFGTERLLKSN